MKTTKWREGVRTIILITRYLCTEGISQNRCGMFHIDWKDLQTTSLSWDRRLDTFYSLPDSFESVNKGKYKSVPIFLTTNGIFSLLYCLQHESVPKAALLPWDLYIGDLSRSPKGRTFVFITLSLVNLSMDREE